MKGNNRVEYNEKKIGRLFKENLEHALQKLSCLPVAEGREPKVKGLNGWVYEQTIRYCLSQELKTQGLSPTIEEHIRLRLGENKWAEIDLLIGDRVAVEIKSSGIFRENWAEEYEKRADKAREKGWVYLYLTGTESSERYKKATKDVLGERAFFLDEEGEWRRFVTEVARHLGRSPDKVSL